MTDREPPITRSRSRDLGATIKLVLAGLLVLLLIGLAIDNRESVRVGWIVGDGKAPMILVLLLTAVAGAAIGWLVLHAIRRPGRREQGEQSS